MCAQLAEDAGRGPPDCAACTAQREGLAGAHPPGQTDTGTQAGRSRVCACIRASGAVKSTPQNNFSTGSASARLIPGSSWSRIAGHSRRGPREVQGLRRAAHGRHVPGPRGRASSSWPAWSAARPFPADGQKGARWVRGPGLRPGSSAQAGSAGAASLGSRWPSQMAGPGCLSLRAGHRAARDPAGSTGL